MTHETDFTSVDSPMDDTEAQLEQLADIDRSSAPADLEDRLFAATRLTLQSETTGQSKQPFDFTIALRIVLSHRLLTAAAIILLVMAVGVTLRAKRSSLGGNTIATAMPVSIDEELDEWLALLNDADRGDTTSSLTELSQSLDELEADLSPRWTFDSFEFGTESL